MSGFDIDALADSLSKTSVNSQTFLSFASQGLKLDDAESAKGVVKAIEECQNLEVLELKGNTLGIDAAEFIGKALEKKTGLKRLLWSDLFTGRMKTEIPPALIHLCNGMMVAGVKLEEIDLSDNAFGPNGMMGLVDFLKSPCCYSLKVLKLHNNGLGTTGGKMLADSLKLCYEEGSKVGQPLQLKEFVSGRGRLENEGAQALSEVFKMMKSLQEVHMPQNGINHPGITALAGAFAVNPNLRVLNLSDNTFTEIGSYTMATALECLDNLEEVNFDDCLTRTDGAVAIARALEKKHLKLKVLKLSGNEVELDGAKSVVNAVKNKPDIEVLELKDNEFGTKGVKVIQKMLADASLEHILGNFSDDEDEDDEDGDDEDEDEGEDDEEDATEEFVEISDGDGDDDEGEEEDDDDDEEEEEEDATEDDVVIPNLDEEIKGKILDLVKRPDSKKLMAIIEEDPKSITTFLLATSDRADGAILSLMKIAQLCTDSSSKTNDIIFGYADGLCKKLIEDDENLLVTGMLFCLGLIKGENKEVALPKDKRGPLFLLRHVVHQDYFTKPNKESVWLILYRFKSQLGEQESLGESIANGLKGAGYAYL